MSSKSNDNHLATSALHLLHRAGQCADELFAINIGGTDITPRQYEVLRAVSQHPDPSQTMLVEDTGIDRSTLADIVRRLTQRGLLERQRTQHDARKYAVRLTDIGRKSLEVATPAVSSTNSRLLEALSKDDRESFLLALEKIITAISAPKTRGENPTPQTASSANPLHKVQKQN